MPDLTRLLEARAALEEQLGRDDEISLKRQARRRSAVRGGVEVMLWAGAATGIVALTLYHQGGEILPGPAPRTLAVQSGAGKGPMLASSRGTAAHEERSADRSARETLAARMRVAAATNASDGDAVWEAVGWSVRSDWPRTLETSAAAYEQRGASDVVTAASERSGADRPDLSPPRAEPTETGSIREVERAPDPVAPKEDGQIVAKAPVSGEALAAPIAGRVEMMLSSLRSLMDEARPDEDETAPPPASTAEPRDGAQAAGDCDLAFAAPPQLTRATTAVFRLQSSCGPVERISVSYGGRTFERRVEDGALEIDLFAGPEALALADPRGGRTEWTPPAKAFRGVAKAVVLWSGEADLDLNAQEFSARPGEQGYLRPGQGGTRERAELSGRGYLSTTDDGKGGADHVEVYTFLESNASPRGEVAFGVDARNCVPTEDARYETYLLVNGVKKAQNRSRIASIGCALADDGGAARRLRGFQARLATPFSPI